MNTFINEGTRPPYNDDFDAKKNYMRVMYKAGYPVQARELTQSQTALQNQLAQSGSFLFKDGTPIKGARIRISIENFMIVQSTNVTGQPIDMRSLVGLTFTGDSSNQKIIINRIDSKSRAAFFSYIGGTIVDGESFTSTTTPTRQFTMTPNSIGQGLIANNTEGVLFVSGYYINVDESNLIISTTDINAEYNIGYKVESSFVTSSTDPSLNDNATGSPNFSAPGADRFKISASLFSFTGTLPGDVNFIQGIVVKNKKIIKDQSSPLDNSDMMDVLAKRTYDESGSYTVKPWKIQLFDDNADKSTYRVNIQEGNGYIKGYDVTTISSVNLNNDKSRTTKEIQNVNVFNDFGLYTYALFENDLLSASKIPQFYTQCKVMTGKNGAGTSLGECKISSLYKEGLFLRIYIYDAGSVLNTFSGARSIVSATDSSQYINLYIDQQNSAELNGQELPFIYDLGQTMVKDVIYETIEYQTVKRYSAISENTGNTLTIIDSDANTDFMTTESLLVIYDSTGNQVNLTNVSCTPSNSLTTSTASIKGSTIKNATEYNVIIRVAIKNATPRTKTLKTVTETFTLNSSNTSVTLSKEDIFDVVSITQTTNTNASTPDELKSYLTLDNGQRDYLYDSGKILGFNSEKLKSFIGNLQNTVAYSITFRYFEHSGTGAFCANSYTTTTNKTALGETDMYSSMLPYKSSVGFVYNLHDCVDYRVKRSELSDITNISPRTEFTCNLNKYLPRVDTVYVNSVGEFGIINGIPSETPIAPVVADNSMSIYTIYNSAYCLSINSVRLTYIDNRRYTMKDIGKLDTRIANVENSLAVTQLEQSAINTNITDSDGMNKYKTGIFTDNFSSFKNSDYTNKEWDANIDSVEQSLRGNYNAENYSFNYIGANSTNVTKSANLVHLNYTTEVYASNEFASSTLNIQKLLFHVWEGNLKLTPSVDTWINDLGQFIVSEKYVDTPPPPTTFRTWSTSTSERFGSIMSWWGTTTTTVTTTEKTDYTSSWVEQDIVTEMEKQDEFMRIRSVEYSCEGLRPGMTLVGKLDGKPLELSNNQIDMDGKCTGSFTIPDKIPVGVKNVEFRDTANSSEASTTYSATGKTIWKNIDRTYIRNWTPVVTQTSTSSSSTIRRYDPIAETIFVDNETGIFVDSIDVYFASKDNVLPVWMYMVEVDNGYPSNRQLPFSVVYKQASEIVVSDNCSVPTKFKFDSPIYLEGNTEYAFVIATGSYSYSVYISTLGENDIKSGVGIYEQPYLGSLFLSQNARTWTAEQQSDITFKLNKCVFDTTKTGTAVFSLGIPAEDYNVSTQNIVINDFNLAGTKVSYSYKWYNDSVWTPFNNRNDVFLNTMKIIRGNKTTSNSSIQLKAEFSSENTNISPLIDLEQVYGVFCNNTVKDNDDPLFPFIDGTYISNSVTLKNDSQDIRVILDAILPNQSDVDVYVQTTAYKPLYVVQSSKGTIGTDIANLELLQNKLLRVYYYDTTGNQLEPQSQVYMTGYNVNGKKIYLSQVGSPDEFKNVTPDSPNDNSYTGLDTKYTSILLLPVYSSTKIALTNWSSESTYKAGTFVVYQGNIWKAIREATTNVIPSDVSITWEKIPSLKTISGVKTDTEIFWRPMKKDISNLDPSVKTGSKFVEYTYYPEISIESEFRTFAVKLVMKSKDKINIPRIKNLRAIATI